MARRPYVPHKTQLEQFVEHGRQVSEKIRREYEEWGHLVAERRKEAGLSRKALAAMIGVSDSTIRNLERSRCKSVNPETLNRLRNVPALRLPASLSDGDFQLTPGYQAFWLHDYDPGALLEQARRQLLLPATRLLYEALDATKAATERYAYMYSTGAYGRHVENSRSCISSILQTVLHLANRQKMDLVCLASGHGWTEIPLVQQFLYQRESLIDRIELIHPNIHILKNGIRAFETAICKEICQKSINVFLGCRSSYIDALRIAKPRQKQRLFVIFQVLLNIDNFDRLVQNLSWKMQTDDMLLFDVRTPLCDSQIPREIFAADSRLNQQLPRSFITAAENRIGFSLKETDPSIQHIEWLYDLNDPFDASSNSLESYSVHIKGILHRSTSGPQTVSAMRIHRHNPALVSSLLEKYGLKLVDTIAWENLPEINYPGCYMLFIKT